MKVLVLFDVARAVDPAEPISIKALRREERKPTEADVISCLRALGHEVDRLAVYDNVRDMFDRIASFSPDVVFNLCETFFFDRAHEPNIPAMLDLMKVKYTGAGPEALPSPPEALILERLQGLWEGEGTWLGAKGRGRLAITPVLEGRFTRLEYRVERTAGEAALRFAGDAYYAVNGGRLSGTPHDTLERC